MKRFDNINVIPLIDVMLVLLAIVLTTASFIVKDNLKIELPETESTQAYVPSKEAPPLNFHIDHNNQIYLDEVAQTIDQIHGHIMTLNKKQTIVIQVDKSANFGSFVNLIDLLKKHQLNNLTILTKSKKSHASL